MKLIVISICLIIIGCNTPTTENRCCTKETCEYGSVWSEKAKCLERFTDSLEHELEITKLKMHYECKEADDASYGD